MNMDTLLNPKKLLFRILTGFGILVIVMIVCTIIGTHSISFSRILKGAYIDGAPNPDYEIYFQIRLPRVILAAIVGAALATSGVALQGLLRNPLADPYILGISSGAGLGAIIAVIWGFSWTIWGRSPIAVFAFVGAFITITIVWFFGRLTGKYHITGLLLGGVIINAFLSSVIMFLTSIAQSQQVHTTIFWLMGNITEEDSFVIWTGAGLILAGVTGLFFLAARLNILCFGQEDARSVGINVKYTQAAVFAIAALITAVAVSLSGLIGFVGLVIPHGVRLLFGPDHRQLIPLSAIAGACFLLAADTIARIVVAPAQLPVGVVTAIVGGPIFLLMLIKYCKTIGWNK